MLQVGLCACVFNYGSSSLAADSARPNGLTASLTSDWAVGEDFSVVLPLVSRDPNAVVELLLLSAVTKSICILSF